MSQQIEEVVILYSFMLHHLYKFMIMTTSFLSFVYYILRLMKLLKKVKNEACSKVILFILYYLNIILI